MRYWGWRVESIGLLAVSPLMVVVGAQSDTDWAQ